MSANDIDHLKHEAAARALQFVEPGMKLGLGSGSTSEAFINLLGARVRGGLDVIGVPTSERTAQLARSLGIALGNLNDLAPLDIDFDGARTTILISSRAAAGRCCARRSWRPRPNRWS